MLIAYTRERVALAAKKVGDEVNVEVDVLAKYAEKSMAGYLGAGGGLERAVEKMVARGLAGRPDPALG